MQRIVEAVDPERIILFGSRAKGTAEDAERIRTFIREKLDLNA